MIAARSLACPDLAGRGVARKLSTVVYSPVSGEEALAWELELRNFDGEVLLRMSDLAPFEVADADGVYLRVSGLFVWARPPEAPAKVLPGALDGLTAALDPQGSLGSVMAFEELVLPGDEVVIRAFDLSRGVAGLGYREAKVVRYVSGDPGAPMALLRASRPALSAGSGRGA